MLRPQVFALQEGEVEIGLICSEKQAIDATLQSLAREDPRFGTVADRYWNARGGSYTDGGAFIFSVQEKAPGALELTCSDKFGREITSLRIGNPTIFGSRSSDDRLEAGIQKELKERLTSGSIPGLFNDWKSFLAERIIPAWVPGSAHLAGIGPHGEN